MLQKRLKLCCFLRVILFIRSASEVPEITSFLPLLQNATLTDYRIQIYRLQIDNSLVNVLHIYRISVFISISSVLLQLLHQ